MGNTPIANLPYPALANSPNVPADMQSLATALDSVLVPRFATTTARDAAITAPVGGELCWTNTPAGHWYYTGTAWNFQGRAGCRVRRVAAQTLANNTATSISWDTEDEDPQGFIAVTSSTITIPAGFSGTYAITAKQILSATPGTNRTYLEIAVTSALTGMTTEWRQGVLDGGELGRIVITPTIRLDGGDSFNVNTFQQTGGSLTVTGHLSCFRVGL